MRPSESPAGFRQRRRAPSRSDRYSNCRIYRRPARTENKGEPAMSQTTNTTITPHLCSRNASEALDFYRRAFGAEIETEFKRPDGKLMHACVNVNGARFFLTEEMPECGALGPQSLGGSPVTLDLHVPDCD